MIDTCCSIPPLWAQADHLKLTPGMARKASESPLSGEELPWGGSLRQPVRQSYLRPDGQPLQVLVQSLHFRCGDYGYPARTTGTRGLSRCAGRCRRQGPGRFDTGPGRCHRSPHAMARWPGSVRAGGPGNSAYLRTAGRDALFLLFQRLTPCLHSGPSAARVIPQDAHRVQRVNLAASPLTKRRNSWERD